MAEGNVKPQWHASTSAHLRFLSDEGSAASAVVGACIAFVAMLLAAGGLGAAGFLWQRHRARNGLAEVQKVQVKSKADNSGKQAWPDPEAGVEQAEIPLPEKAALSHAEAASTDKLAASVRLELCETLRNVLEEEIPRGLKASGISDRLDRLEQQARDQQVLSGSLLPPNSKRGCLEDLDSTMKPQACSASESSATVKKEVSKSELETLASVPLCDAATVTDEPLPRVNSGPFQSNLTLSPSARQKRFTDPPEKGWCHVDEDKSLRLSFATVSRNLARRDVQTQELHRQLRATQQDCVRQKLEATHSARKLHDLLSDPTHAPQVQAAELQALRQKVDDLSTRLADTKSSEMQWFLTAKRQRAFFMQSERVATEGVNVFRKHPAGELFLAPPPVYLEDDLDEDPRRPPWDVGTSHINPYVIDSWPFEPNACAQTCAAEPNLTRWEEEDGVLDSDDSEEGSPVSDNGGRSHLHLRLPMLPPEAREQEFDPPEPAEPPEPLDMNASPTGALSSRTA